MGWASGSEIFNPVARTLQVAVPDRVAREAVCESLIDALTDHDWDTESESLGLFAEDPAIVAAFARHGIFQGCYAEHETKPWQCEERLGHTGDHKDYAGNTWPVEPVTVPREVKRAALEALERLDELGAISLGYAREAAAEELAKAVCRAQQEAERTGG